MVFLKGKKHKLEEKQQLKLQKIYEKIYSNYSIENHFYTIGKFYTSDGYFLLVDDGLGTIFRLYKITNSAPLEFAQMPIEYIVEKLPDIQHAMKKNGKFFDSYYQGKIAIEGIILWIKKERLKPLLFSHLYKYIIYY